MNTKIHKIFLALVILVTVAVVFFGITFIFTKDKNMNPKLKSLLTSAAIVFIFLFATLGIVRLFWNTDDSYKFEGRAKFIGILLILFTFVYVIGIYHIVGVARVDNYYFGLIIFLIVYLVVGVISYLFMPEKK